MKHNIKKWVAACSMCLCITVSGTLQVAAQNTEKSGPSLSLTGTVIGKAGGNTAVLMDELKHKQYLVHEGDTLMNIVVQKVDREKVVLLRNGQKEVLRLKGRKGEAVSAKDDQTMPLAERMPPPPPPALAPMTP
jgi:type II secretory pathway component PulC